MLKSYAASRLRRASLVFVLAIVGCNSRPVVTGTVTYQNNPLANGEVSFIGADGKSRSGQIGIDGRYEIIDPPLGNVNVVVVATQVESPGKVSGSPLAGAKNDKSPTVRSLIPTRYNDPASSQLAYVVIPGKQTKDIELVE